MSKMSTTEIIAALRAEENRYTRAATLAELRAARRPAEKATARMWRERAALMAAAAAEIQRLQKALAKA